MGASSFSHMKVLQCYHFERVFLVREYVTNPNALRNGHTAPSLISFDIVLVRRLSVDRLEMKSLVCCFLAFAISHVAFGGEPIPLASGGGISLYSVPNERLVPDLWPELEVATIVLKTDDPIASMRGFEGVSISGEVVQVWNELQFRFGHTALRPEIGLFREAWIPLDTHLLLTEDMIGDGNYTLTEANDFSLGRIGPSGYRGEELPCTGCHGNMGIGPTSMGPADVLFLKPEFASNEIALAQVVSTGPAFISVRVLGSEDGENSIFAEASFDSVPIVFNVPEPSCSAVWFCFLAGVLFCRGRV